MAKCLPLSISLPTLPAGFTIPIPTLLPITLDLTFCCKVASFTIPLPITLPAATIQPAFILAINAALDTIEAYVDALPLKCPRE